MDILDVFIAEIRKFGIRRAAILAGLTYMTVWQWTAKRTVPTLAAAQRVAKVMGKEFRLADKE